MINGRTGVDVSPSMCFPSIVAPLRQSWRPCEAPGTGPHSRPDLEAQGASGFAPTVSQVEKMREACTVKTGRQDARSGYAGPLDGRVEAPRAGLAVARG
eukprot:7403435-Pyramimonas_sp.AAC.1